LVLDRKELDSVTPDFQISPLEIYYQSVEYGEQANQFFTINPLEALIYSNRF
jgi:hypothetical protein